MSASTPHPQALVWVVDDDRELLSLLEQRISASGWQPRSFESGEALEEALAEQTPQVLVLDRLLPRQSGTHLLQRLRQQGHRFPVLMLSALGSAAARIEGLEVGANDYMAKPFHWRELQLRLERLLEQQSAADLALQPQPFRIGAVHFDPAALLLRGPSGVEQPISRGDARVLSLLCSSAGEAISRELLLQASGSLLDTGSSRTLDVRISKLRRLFEACAPGSSSLLEAVRGQGYRLTGSVQPDPAP